MKKIAALLLTLILVVLCLASCDLSSITGMLGGGGQNNDGENNDQEGNENVDPDLIYGKGVTTTIIIPAGTSYNVFSIETALFNQTGMVYVTKDDSSQKEGSEIVIGSTTREISEKAQSEFDKKLLAEIRKNFDEEFAEKDLVGFTVYASGNSVALVWKNDEIYSLAIDYLNNNLLNKKDLKLEDGFSYTEIFSISEYRTEQ